MTETVIQLLKLSLSVYFSLAKIHNATENELNAIYQTEKDKFTNNTLDKLEDV